MTHAIRNMIRNADAAIARMYLSMRTERNGVLMFLFHSLFRNEAEIQRNLVDPLQRTTVAQFRQFVEYYLRHGYKFIGPEEIARGIKADGKYAVITFDDGYYNNTLALPILEEHGVPAIFFTCTDAIRDNRCFWWDVLYRELAGRGVPPRTIYLEGLSLKLFRTEQIEAQLSRRFGPSCFEPRTDVDRPLSVSELKDFAARPFVHIGNHTAGHAILTNYSAHEIRREIQSAQDSLREITGRTPIAISYPNGGYNAQVVQISRELGFKIGFTTRQKKLSVPLAADAPQMMELDRFCLHGGSPILTQCRTCRSDLQVYGTFQGLYISRPGRVRAPSGADASDLDSSLA